MLPPLQRLFAALAVTAGALLLATGCGKQEYPRPLQAAPASKAQPVTIHQPEKLSAVATGDVDANGQPLQVACGTCHSMREPRELPKKPEDLEQFHTGLRFSHGTLGCSSCHQAGNPPTLHLADGRKLPTTDALSLCAQCHGQQYRSYTHGAHGGMNGYWDLSRGPRLRNNCVDCHDPHTPKFQGARPVLAPRDRLLPPPEAHVEEMNGKGHE